MRQVSMEVGRAFLNRESKKIKNTATDGDTLYLHGNAIARHDGDDVVMTLAGWPTVTTRERLNTLLHLMRKPGGFYQHNHKQFYGIEEIDDADTVTVSKLPESGTAKGAA